MSVLKIDEKWSIEYDEENNDRPVAFLRYGNVVVHDMDNVHVALFYALLGARIRLEKGNYL